MLKDFLGEVAGIMEQFESYRIHLFTFDTAVHNPQQFNSENLENISDYEPKGGGGTDFDSLSLTILRMKKLNPSDLLY
jgi:predicted metal-dependent peptidase